ncbi:MAG TPA: hypothetical protein VGK55_10515 [Actinomycetes bacterium]
MTDDEGPLFNIEPRSKRRRNGHNGAAETAADDPAATSTGSNAGIWLWRGDSATPVWSPETAQDSGSRAAAGSGGTRLRAAQGWVGANPVRLVLALATPAVLLLGWALAGTLGVFIVLSAGFVLGILAIRSQLPRGPRPPRRRRPPVPFLNADFPAYRRIEDTLFWAPVSARHFDHAVRPLLSRLLATVLAERHGVDMTVDLAAAKEAIGADLWPLVDPTRPVSDDTRAPGVPLPVVMRFLARLEALDTGGSVNAVGTPTTVESHVYQSGGARANNGVHDNKREEP